IPWNRHFGIYHVEAAGKDTFLNWVGTRGQASCPTSIVRVVPCFPVHIVLSNILNWREGPTISQFFIMAWAGTRGRASCPTSWPGYCSNPLSITSFKIAGLLVSL